MENIDCIVEILSNLPIVERESCRLVSNKWSYCVDILARGQHYLNVIGAQLPINNDDNSLINNEFELKRKNIINTIHWPHKFIHYERYCLLLNRFSNLWAIRFESIDYWNDYLIEELARYCPLLTEIAFVRCYGIGINFF